MKFLNSMQTQPRSLTRWGVQFASSATDSDDMAGVRSHVFAVAIVALAAAVVGLFLTVWRPRYEPSTRHAPDVPVPYTHVQFTASDAERAFAAVGVRLVPKSRVPGIVTTIGTADDRFEVDVFGSPTRVNALGGSPEVITDVRGKYVHIPRTCTRGIPDAERWNANVRFVVRCANVAHAQLLALGTRALAKL